MPISVTTSTTGEVNIVHVSGEIDVTSAAVLRDALEALIADGRRRLTLDLGEVTFMDSTGLGIVVGRLKKLTRHGGVLTVAADHERVLRVFTITGLDQLIDIHPTLEGAVRAADVDTPHV
ncbi:STAS domain-containing protein [Janibacter anophelis]|uniref:STAS domain-containing protein n=1 Tax=Janibacter anophelis TaxID=319054 RepID=UPI000DF01380|nr:STAS domain-containing protein [Janibacter anophelis]